MNIKSITINSNLLKKSGYINQLATREKDIECAN